ncbi:hypothetical protein NHH73_02770 [Oxalobacteraceae bacterium OTU3CINTB1]|nr:hypothetical protein NHH73_02770 [Oxalobacteraceae bacterium OTU3CINTB1]
MEWVTGINLATGAINVVDASLRAQQLPSFKAFNRGTPSAASTRMRITMALACLRHSAQAENDYLEAFGLQASPHSRGQHLVFETTVNSVRYVIPALVLMRTLFTPCRYLLDTMFRPHALDQTCFIEFGAPEPALTMLATWATEANSRRFAPWEPRLKWMQSHQSAYHMAGSVHEFAARGVIGLSMPRATISATVDGVRNGDDFFVTKCMLITIVPQESPIANMAPMPLIVAHHKPRFLAKEHPGRQLVSSAPVPTHPDGSLDLTDDEWIILRPIVVRNSASRYQHCPRMLLDGVLAKMASARAWKKMKYKVGNWMNASHTHQALRKSGAMDEVMKFLNASRSPSPGQACGGNPQNVSRYGAV